MKSFFLIGWQDWLWGYESFVSVLKGCCERSVIMEKYFDGKDLYGDDFSFDEIKKWYDEEAEGYADLGSKNRQTYEYCYHNMNIIHGYNKIKGLNFSNVLGFGSAYGFEFEPLIERIEKLTIIEPSDNLVSNKIGGLIPEYVKPDISGKLPFDDNSFDLITCFDTLHHVANVSCVISELIRVLRGNGYFLVREPIISMGDWRKSRAGLTKNERGIPMSIFENLFDRNNSSLEVISKDYCFTATSYLSRNYGFLFKKPIVSYKSYVVFDKLISWALKSNVKYHATKKIERIAPSSIFYVIRKL